MVLGGVVALGSVAHAAVALLGTLLTSIVVGIGALRPGTLSPAQAWTLIVVGVGTLPLLLVTPFSFDTNLLTDELAFLLSGIALLILGARLTPGPITGERSVEVAASPALTQ